MTKYQVVTYDVWGNAQDGFEVNQSFVSNTIELEMDRLDTDRKLIAELKRIGEIKKSARYNSVNITGENSDTLYFEHGPTGRPEFELRNIED